MLFFIRLLVNAAALWVATQIVPGVSFSGGALPLLGVALVFGVVNALIRPVAKILTFPLIILTLGIFALVINGLMSSLSSALGLGFHVSGFWAAFWGALVVSLVSTMLSLFIADSKRRD